MHITQITNAYLGLEKDTSNGKESNEGRTLVCI